MTPGGVIAISVWLAFCAWLAYECFHAPRADEPAEPAWTDDDFAFGVLIAMDDLTPNSRRHSP